MPEMAFPHHHHQHHHHLTCWFILLTSLMLFNGSSTSTSLASPTNMTTAPKTTKPGCPHRCGNLTVPYPFGIGRRCALGKLYEIHCNKSFNPSRGFLMTTNIEVFNISEKYVRISNSVATSFYKNNLRENVSRPTAWTWFTRGQPYSFSGDQNMFTVIGCDDYAWIKGTTNKGQSLSSGCMSKCSDRSQVMKNSCTGMGCCQIFVPKGLKSVSITLQRFADDANISSFDNSSYAFLGERNRFTFGGVEDLSDPEFVKRIHREVPIVIDWDVGNGTKCAEAKLKKSTYACQGNTTYCTDSESYIASGGYRCSCLPGYEGNPYLPPAGCTDIDECAQNSTHNCSHYCSNVIGSYKCSCPKRHDGDGFRNGTGCVPHKYQLPMIASLGTSIGLLFIFICISIIYFITRSRKIMKVREKFFQQNGGYLLRQQLALTHGGVESSTIFTINELKLATDNFSEDRIIGKGGHGTVYKGILQNNLIVAIKKSKVSDRSQIAEFINEIVILTQINHRNVVKLFGCCLEIEVPLLVYEFVPNGTLLEHIQNSNQAYWLTWVNCVRIASQIANAVSYLHSAANPPIIHRDIKSANILIDNMYSAKVSDFGGSKLILLDQTQVTTLIQGTLGYLDPEYLHSSQLTEKSDVYSFGVVLAEILTRKKPFSFDQRMKHNNLATYFLMAIEEDQLHEIIHPQLLRETSKKNLVFMAMLVKRCLNLNGKDRPTMKEVAKELEELRDNMKHPWDEPSYEEATSLMGSAQVDLYPIPSKTDEALYGNSLGQCSIQKNMIDEMKHPR